MSCPRGWGPRGLAPDLLGPLAQQVLHPPGTCQACLPEPPNLPSREGREPREGGRHKGPFVPVARARPYLLSLGKQEAPGGPLCYDNLKSIFFPS